MFDLKSCDTLFFQRALFAVTYFCSFETLVAFSSYFITATTSSKSFLTDAVGASEANFSYEGKYNFAHT